MIIYLLDHVSRLTGTCNMATTVVHIGLHYLPYRHRFKVNIIITPHVSKGLDDIWAHIAYTLLA